MEREEIIKALFLVIDSDVESDSSSSSTSSSDDSLLDIVMMHKYYVETNMTNDLFKEDFKYYKSRCPPPKYTNVLKFSASENGRDDIKNLPIKPIFAPEELEKSGLRPLHEWDAYTLDRRKGLIYIRNPFSNIGQRLWIVKCLQYYSRKPNKLNLDVHGDLGNTEDWWDVCHKDKIRNENLLKKLRWSTLGYHHDWDSKVYAEDNKNKFPDDLSQICKIVMQSVGFPDFIPQASIVNYYHMDSTLAPHTDHSEVNLEAPLISISFGQSAIFLIGGETKESKPDALLLESGDILIMSKESRLCYHAVPRIMPATEKPWDNINNEEDNNGKNISDNFSHLYDEEFWQPFREYVNDSRINLNVRQVLFQGQNSLMETK